MIACDTARNARLDQSTHNRDDPRTVRSPIDEVPDEDQRPVGGRPFRVDPETMQQCQEGVQFPVDIPDDVERAIGKRLNQSRHRTSSPSTCPAGASRSSPHHWGACPSTQTSNQPPRSDPARAPLVQTRVIPAEAAARRR